MERLLRGAGKLGIELDASQLDRFESFYQEMVDWNRRINLTSVTEYEEVQTRHFLDSLSVSAAIPGDMPRGARLLDVGSGAGLPGVPLAIAHSGLSVTLLEATEKKAAFLEHLVGSLKLGGVGPRRGAAGAVRLRGLTRGRQALRPGRADAALLPRGRACSRTESARRPAGDRGRRVRHRPAGREATLRDADHRARIQRYAAPRDDRQEDSDALPVPETAGDSVEAPLMMLATDGA